MEITLPTIRGINNRIGCFFCSNFRKDPKGGMMADYSLQTVAVKIAGTTTEWLPRLMKFVQREYNGDITIFGRAETSGDIWATDYYGIKVFRAMDNSETAYKQRGLMIDSQGEIVYVGNRYVGRTATSKLDGALAQGANTVNVISVAGAPTAGYAFIKHGSVSAESETIQYTGITGNQLTGVTRGKFNTGDKAHPTAKEIIFFDDDWQDLGSGETSDVRPTIKFGDYNLIGNVNKIAGWKETNFSDWSTALVTLPVGCAIVDFSMFHYGVEPMVMIAVNIEEKGMLFFCTRDDIQNGEYSAFLPVEENIKKLHKNYVGCESGVYETDGYDLKLVAPLPDDEGEIRSADFDIFDIASKENFLLITANCGQMDRNRTGLWILDLIDKSWYYVLPSNYGVYGLSFGAVFISSEWRIFVSTDYSGGAIDKLATVAKARGNYYQVIYDPKTSETYQLQTIKLNLATKLKQYYNNQDFNFDIILRYYDFKRPFLQYTQTKEASAAKNQIVIYDTLGVPKVGDRVEIIQREAANFKDVAAAPRNVTAVEHDTGKYTLTLDEDLPEQIDATTGEYGQMILINPLKYIGKISVNSLKIDLEDLERKVTDMPEFKKIMIEAEIRCGNIGISQNLLSMTLTFTPK